MPDDKVTSIRLSVACFISKNIQIITLWNLSYGSDRDSIPGRGREFFPSPPRPDRLWGSHRLLPNGYRGLFSRE